MGAGVLAYDAVWAILGGGTLILAALIAGGAAVLSFRDDRARLRAFLEGGEVPESGELDAKMAPLLDTRALTVVAVVAGATAAAQIVTGQPLVALSLGGVAGVVTTGMANMRKKKARRELATQFADSLSGFASAMIAGNSFARGLQQVVQGSSEPIRSEWEQVLAEVELGSPVSTAVAGMAERTKLHEVEWLAHVLRLHERTGTPAAGLLKQITEVVRQNEGLELEITGLTAEGRLAAYVVAALPVGLAVFIQFMQPEYLDPFSQGKGIFVSIAMVCSILGGLFWIRRMVAAVEA